MKKIAKKIVSVIVAAVTISSLGSVFVNAAVTRTFSVSSATATATLDAGKPYATATTSINRANCGVTVSAHGEYYVKGTATHAHSSNGNGSGNSGTSTSISNGGGSWISIDTNHSASYDGSTGNYSIHW